MSESHGKNSKNKTAPWARLSGRRPPPFLSEFDVITGTFPWTQFLLDGEMPGADPGPGDSGTLLSVSRGRAAWTRGGRDQTLPPGGPGTGRSLDASCGGAASGGPQLDRGATPRSGQQGRAERLGRASHARQRPQTRAVAVLLGQAVTSLLCRTGNAQRQGLLGWGRFPWDSLAAPPFSPLGSVLSPLVGSRSGWRLRRGVTCWECGPCGGRWPPVVEARTLGLGRARHRRGSPRCGG